ncbi:uncharacterized protein LAJ45_01468 [Morchella importuna]|uniref:uncharacterized protein n=1 Tax=Morchella importuna TaxID=1174673 RepID=UPI001E8DC929|nr:uncharacterized protein LAJ45_01468 [Morchella importuna]KAH8154936.1 hypothetical protein LAJ45_01468 [Morchella importuna]
MGNGQFKLYFPSHAMPFIIPNAEIPNIVAMINLMLKDMETKGVTKAGGFTFPASDGFGATISIEMPTPGDWILVDTYYSTVIHQAVAKSTVRGSGTYMVLPMKDAGLSAADLKAACAKAAAGAKAAAELVSPPRYEAMPTASAVVARAVVAARALK